MLFSLYIKKNAGVVFPELVWQIDPFAVVAAREGDRPFKSSLPGKADDQKRKTEYLVKVHFDNFTSKWDESYGESEWRERKLVPLYTKVRLLSVAFFPRH